MTAIRARRVGCAVRSTPPSASQSATAPTVGIVGPDLPGAACKGRAPLWDDRVPGELVDERTARHEQAVTICRTCPERARCLAARLTDPGLGEGVWGGQVFSGGRKCHCGAVIPAEANRQQVHCSEACRNTRRGKDKAVRSGICEICGTEFTTVVPHRRYCDDKCRRNGTVRPGTAAVELPGLDRCQGCGAPLIQGPGRGRRNCSKRCRRRASEQRLRYRTAA